MAKPKIYRILNSPVVYSLVQNILLIGAKKLRGKVFNKVFNNSPKMVLDVGCGPQLKTSSPKGIVVGVDINPEYIKTYTGGEIDTDTTFLKRYTGERTKFGFVCPAENLPFENNLFDESRCMGLLHHLPTEIARTVIKEMFRCVKSGGRIVIIDNVWPRNAIFRPLAWLIRRFDHGEYVRDEEKLLNLVQSSCHGPWQSIRYTYTYYGLEGMIITLQKAGTALQ